MNRISLTQGKFALVDDEDYEWLMKWKWICTGSGAGRKMDENSTVLMHREIMNTPEGMVVDHIDHNTYNNQKSNLRNCTHAQNIHNQPPRGATSNFKGVYFHEEGQRWTASIGHDGQTLYLGAFKTEEAAALAYNEAAARIYGTNEPKPSKRGEPKYISVYQPEHPRADITGQVPIHVLVVEQNLGRSLWRGEIVHHANHNKNDNSPANLIVMSRKEHQQLPAYQARFIIVKGLYDEFLDWWSVSQVEDELEKEKCKLERLKRTMKDA